jgi:hypothetical protein
MCASQTQIWRLRPLVSKGEKSHGYFKTEMKNLRPALPALGDTVGELCTFIPNKERRARHVAPGL